MMHRLQNTQYRGESLILPGGVTVNVDNNGYVLAETDEQVSRLKDVLKFQYVDTVEGAGQVSDPRMPQSKEEFFLLIKRLNITPGDLRDMANVLERENASAPPDPMEKKVFVMQPAEDGKAPQEAAKEPEKARSMVPGELTTNAPVSTEAPVEGTAADLLGVGQGDPGDKVKPSLDLDAMDRGTLFNTAKDMGLKPAKTADRKALSNMIEEHLTAPSK